MKKNLKCKSYQLVFLDESGCNTLDAQRTKGQAPRGIAPVLKGKFTRDKKRQILPAYAQDGVLFHRIYDGSIDGEIFENFIEELLQYCGRFPAPKSVLVMDNVSFHHSQKILDMCNKAGVKLLFLPPYSPDLNPIEEFFSDLKRFIKKGWQKERCPELPFNAFLRWSVGHLGRKEQDIDGIWKNASAEGHFRNSGIHIEYPS